jgi:hypothetical protein
MGEKLARASAKANAAESFFLGKGLGSAYYTFFPPHLSQSDILLATVPILFGVALITWIVTFLSDPVQYGLGLHRRRLERLLVSLENRHLLHAWKVESERVR